MLIDPFRDRLGRADRMLHDTGDMSNVFINDWGSDTRNGATSRTSASRQEVR